MKIVAGVLTFRAKQFGRILELRETLGTLSEADALYLLDNGSDDGSGELVRGMGGTVAENLDGITTAGRGMNLLIGALAATDADVIVFSNDDIRWRPGWRAQVEAFWAAAPPAVKLMSGLLERQDYPWARVRARVEYGGVVALLRESAPGAAWTMRREDWELIGPCPEKVSWDDVPTCQKLRARGYHVAQADLAEHIGGDKSTWGNPAHAYPHPALDLARYGIIDAVTSTAP